MKPNFALDFRNDAITLLHRTPRGWQPVGQVPLDTPDLAEALSYLRSTALGLAPKGLTTKLVIPNDQILFTKIRAPAPDAGRRRKQVARGLEGVTPYDVADLSFDMSGEGPELDVAVIARETLAEAENFAIQHRFNPVSFVAVADSGTFEGEPWFGPTAFAETLLAEGETVERDAEPVVILSRDLPNRSAPPAEDPVAAAAEDPVSAPAEEKIQVFDAEPAEPPVMAEPDPEPVVDPDTSVTPDPVSTVADQANSREPAPPTAAPEPAPEPAHEPQTVHATLPEAQAPLAEPVAAAVQTQFHLAAEAGPATFEMPPAPEPSAPPPAPQVEEAPIALDVVDDLPDTPAAASASVLDPSIPDDIPPPPAASIMMAFASRRAAEAAAKEAAGKSSTTKTGSAKAASGKAPALGAVSATRSVPAPKVTTLPPRTGSTVVPMQSRPSGATSGANPGTTPPTAKPPIKGSATGKALRGLGALVTAPSIPGARDRRAMVGQTTPTSGPTAAASAAAATLTKPGSKPYSGGLGSRGMVDRGKPRYLGLILTGILLVFLALVAAWSTFFLNTNDTTGAATPAATATPDQTAAASDAPPAPEDEMLADGVDPEQLPAVETADVTPETLVEVPLSDTAPQTPLSTETATAQQPASDPQDEIFLAAMDEPPAMPDALSLPRPAALNEQPPAPATPPPPFGTVYQFDDQGNILPTPEGIFTPEGVLLVAGRPKLVPPPRPATLAPPPAPETPTTAATIAGAATPAAAAPEPFADPALAGARPRTRPATLVPPTQNADDDASLAPATGSRFASLRPRARPVELAAATAAPAIPPVNPPANPAATATPDLGAQGASLTAQANAANAAAAIQRSPLAIMVSRKPAQRPKDMSRAVEAAVAVASRQPERTPTPEADEPTARTEPEADDEPEVAKSMPRLPTKTSVAKQATFVNAINLSKVNLIGVYGTQSNRYALIRQTNGRYKKVKVGDSFDGGRVAAITASEVRYQKSGKIHTLALPKS